MIDPNILKIINERIKLEIEQQSKYLLEETDRLKAEMAAKGLSQSGAMIKGIAKLCEQSIGNRAQRIWETISRFITTSKIKYSESLATDLKKIVSDYMPDSLPDFKHHIERNISRFYVKSIPSVMEDLEVAHAISLKSVGTEIDLLVQSLKNKNDSAETDNYMSDLDSLIHELEDISTRFVKGDNITGLFLQSDNEALFKQKIMELTTLLDEIFGDNNRYSINIVNTVNQGSGGFVGGPSLHCVKEVIGILNASKTQLSRDTNRDKTKTSQKSSNLKITEGNTMTTISSLKSKDIWSEIEKEYDLTKRAFGIKIKFVSDKFAREIIFRDVGQSYMLAKIGFPKPAVILAGSVIEELLRLYLKHKKISISNKTFDGYIQACKDNGLLKSAVYSLTDSVRHFRNHVHLAKEKNKKHTISKATAKGAVSSIFTLANDFD